LDKGLAELDANIVLEVGCNIGVNPHYIPVYQQPHFEKMGFKRGAFLEAKRYYSEAISLPIYPTLHLDEVRFAVNELHQGA
jgi:dTDP-4-amino-4,6-dideoxygalactose transaminase